LYLPHNLLEALADMIDHNTGERVIITSGPSGAFFRILGERRSVWLDKVLSADLCLCYRVERHETPEGAKYLEYHFGRAADPEKLQEIVDSMTFDTHYLAGDNANALAPFSLVSEVFGAEEVVRFLSALAIGLLTSVQRGVMSLEEAEQLLFTPRTYELLMDRGISPDLCNLVMEACELEDVLSLIPSKFDENVLRSIDQFVALLGRSEAPGPYDWHAEFR